MAVENENNEQNTPMEETAVTNHDFKNTPAYQSMAKQLAELQKEKADREAAEESAKKEAEAKALEAEGNYKAAIEMRQKETEALKAQYEKDLLQRDLKSELYKAGFHNDIFVNGAIAAYKDGDVSEYARTLAADEGNKMFLSSSQTETVQKPQPPGSPSVNGSLKITADNLKQMENSTDRETRLKAIEYKRQQYASGELS